MRSEIKSLTHRGAVMMWISSARRNLVLTVGALLAVMAAMTTQNALAQRSATYSMDALSAEADRLLAEGRQLKLRARAAQRQPCVSPAQREELGRAFFAWDQ